MHTSNIACTMNFKQFTQCHVVTCTHNEVSQHASVQCQGYYEIYNGSDLDANVHTIITLL